MKNLHLFNRSMLGIVALSLAALGTSAQAQESAPIQPQIKATKAEERDPFIVWNAGKMEVREVLRKLDDMCPQTIIVGEGVTGSVEHLGQTMRLSTFLDVLSWAGNLTWGYLNRDTIVVLPARSNAKPPIPDLSQIPLPPTFRFEAPSGKSFTIPLPGTPRYVLPPARKTPAPGEMPNPGLMNPRLRLSPLENVPQNALPREFNGQRYYVVPLQPDFSAAPEPQPYEQPLQPTE